MPTFATPEPISVEITLPVGDVHIVATDRTDTVVTVAPSDPGHEPDLRVAEQTRVEHTPGRLLVRAPKQRTLGLFSFNRVGSIDVTVELPAGSQVQADASVAAFRCAGSLGECRIKTATGDIQAEQTGPFDANTSAGGITVDRITGHAEISTGSGRVRVREIEGSAVIKNSNGDTAVGTITGDLRANAANGGITIEAAAAGVNANTSNGDIRIGSLTRGFASLKTAFGEIEIGIAAGTAARLDVNTSFGRVRNSLDGTDNPAPTDNPADVRAHTSYGDIVIRRAENQDTPQESQ